MVKILVFDTETNDKIPKLPGKTWKEKEDFGKKMLKFSEFVKNKSIWDNYIERWPSIIQLSYILYDTEDPENSKIFNKYIDIPEDIQITDETIKIHHITREKIDAASDINKAKIYDALNEFMSDVLQANVVVAHNAQFDRKMIVAELTRLSKKDNLPQIKAMMNDRHFECTMEKTKPICKLKTKYDYKDKKTGEQKFFYKIKSPKLIEAYNHFFGYEPSGEALHNAIIDAVVCLRVYCISLPHGFDICGTNSIITDYILQISPPDYSCCSKDQPLINIPLVKNVTKTRRKRSKSKSKRSKRSKSKRNKSK